MTTPLRKNQPPQPDVEPPPSRPFRLHALWRAALILFPLNLILVYLAELSGGVSPTTALAQSLGNPLVGVPAFAFVTTAALQRYLSRRHLRQLTRANQVKLDALTHVLFDISERVEVRELAACALARMDPDEAIPLLHKAKLLPPVDDSDEQLLHYSDGISKALLIARGAPPTTWQRLRAATGDADNNRRNVGLHGLEALNRLASHAQERHHTGRVVADLRTDVADADAVVVTLHALHNSEPESKDIGDELLTETESEDESTRLAWGGVRWQE